MDTSFIVFIHCECHCWPVSPIDRVITCGECGTRPDTYCPTDPGQGCSGDGRAQHL